MSETVDFKILPLVIAIKCNLRQFRKMGRYCNDYYEKFPQAIKLKCGYDLDYIIKYVSCQKKSNCNYKLKLHTLIVLLLMLVLKIRLYENIFCSCIIYDFFVYITQIIVASSTKNYGLWPHLDDRYCAVISLVVFSFFEKTTYCCRARRLSVRLWK